MTKEFAAGPTAHVETLIWQSRIRITVACIAAMAHVLLVAEPRDAAAVAAVFPVIPAIVLVTSAYVAIVAAIAGMSRRHSVVRGFAVTGTVSADVAFIFALTIANSAPQYYDRILILAFFALHLTTFYFGRRHAVTVLVLTAFGYLALVSHGISRGAELLWREELWSLGAFLLAATIVLVEHGSLRNRLAKIVHLFSRAEQGDFSEAYDEEGDSRPDAITRVGRAYNRVRGQLANMVLTDPLTGCVNRRGFDQALAREVARAGRTGSELAMLAVDLDHFKAVNDTLGHLAGDAVLREVGGLLLRAGRAGDVVARTGGEEFSFILPDTTAAGAHHVATRLCESVRAHRFGDAAHGVRLTMSVGVVAVDDSFRDARGDRANVLKGRADEALYSAKRAGRDRVRVWAYAGDRAEMGVLA
ncbi:MAG: GGDEF domain-containing protein [Gemmatimonadaceae bacterium]